MEDIQIIRNRILLFTTPSILPLCKPSKRRINLFELDSCMEIKARLSFRTLSLIIRTTSQDAKNIEYDGHHEVLPELPYFCLKLDQSGMDFKKLKQEQKSKTKKSSVLGVSK